MQSLESAMSNHVCATGRHTELTRCQVFFGKNRGIDVRIDVARRQQDQGAAQSVQPDRETGVAHPNLGGTGGRFGPPVSSAIKMTKDDAMSHRRASEEVKAHFYYYTHEHPHQGLGNRTP